MYPLAAHRDLIVTSSGPDTLVYDSSNYQLHTLNATSSAIWSLCTGTHTSQEIAVLASRHLDTTISGEMVDMALRDLARAGLITSPEHQGIATSRQTRRSLLAKAGMGGVLLPTVLSTTVMTAASASSTAQCSQPTVTEQECAMDPGANYGRCCSFQTGGTGRCDHTCNPF